MALNKSNFEKLWHEIADYNLVRPSYRITSDKIIETAKALQDFENLFFSDEVEEFVKKSVEQMLHDLAVYGHCTLLLPGGERQVLYSEQFLSTGPQRTTTEVTVKLGIDELTKVKDEANIELAEERKAEAKRLIKNKMKEIDKAELVVRNLKRELDDLYAEMGS